MPYLRKMLIAINFNGIVTLLNVAKTFTDILKHYFLQMNAAKFKIPLKYISVNKRVLNIGYILNETNTDVLMYT